MIQSKESTKILRKNNAILFLLCFFFGVMGTHRFYVGKSKTGVLYLVTFSLLLIWSFIDLIFSTIFLFKIFVFKNGKLEDFDTRLSGPEIFCLVVFGLLFIGAFIDLITIITGNFKDKEGNKISW